MQMRASLLRRALMLDPALLSHATARRVRRAEAVRRVRKEAEALALADDHRDRAVRVTAVFPEPTPYRAPLLDRVAALPEIDLTVVYAAETASPDAPGTSSRHIGPSSCEGSASRAPSASLHHDYPLTPGVVGALTDARPDVVVVSGWSTFAAQAAIAWCRLKDVPYVLVVESHDEGPAVRLAATVKGTVVPPVVAHASGVLVTGTLARDSMISREVRRPNACGSSRTPSTSRSSAHSADRLSGRRPELRRALGAAPDDVIVLSRRAPRAGEGPRRPRARGRSGR